MSFDFLHAYIGSGLNIDTIAVLLRITVSKADAGGNRRGELIFKAVFTAFASLIDKKQVFNSVL